MLRNKKRLKWYLNLNNYRNTHFQVSNNAKKAYKEYASKWIATLPKLDRIKIELTIYPKDKRLFDVGNIGSIHEKFFLDAVVECEKLVDDNYLFVPETTTRFGCIDKNNPRVDIKIIPIEKDTSNEN